MMVISETLGIYGLILFCEKLPSVPLQRLLMLHISTSITINLFLLFFKFSAMCRYMCNFFFKLGISFPFTYSIRRGPGEESVRALPLAKVVS